MGKHSKRYLECRKLIEKGKEYSLQEAIEILKKVPHPKFDETVELSCKLNVEKDGWILIVVFLPLQ